MQVSKWGNSLAIRLPRAVVKTLSLKEGDEIEVHVRDRRRFDVDRAFSREEALERIRALRWRFPDGFAFDRDEANER
ncbi:MAG TPA: AbrB/MazE/SpoVT family DNA-binding domain-containing protein [Caulobacteraceae bacterium]|nr:AbrB/MazE/SpoVT family DNA-binding domain-containing protein [Caulobacteraceae bacterium]